MKLAYVFGPYNAPTREEVQKNIDLADKVGRDLLTLGYSVIVPHKNTAWWQDDERLTDDMFYEMDLEQVRRCDLLVASQPNWQRSKGSRREVEEAKAFGIPVYESPEEIPEIII